MNLSQKKKIIIDFLAKKLVTTHLIKNRGPIEDIFKIAKSAEPVFDCGVPGRKLPLLHPSPVLHDEVGYAVQSVFTIPLFRNGCTYIHSYVEFPEWFNLLDVKELWDAMPHSCKNHVAFMYDHPYMIMLTVQGSFEGTLIRYIYSAFQIILSVAENEEKSKNVNLWGMGIDPLLKELNCPEFVNN